MRYGILGPVEAWLGGQPLALGGRRQLTLLTVLLVNANRTVSNDELIDSVWGGQRGGEAKRLTVAIARLRRALEPLTTDGDVVLETGAGGYRLLLSDGDLDAQRFESLTRQGREALGRGDAVLAQGLLREALELWRGPALAQVRFEAFAQPEVRRLEELQLLALEARVDADLQIGPDRGLIAELEGLLVRHPTRERLAGQLMLALYRSGRQADSLDVYRRTRARMISELGIEPGTALRTLESQILDQAPTIQVWQGAESQLQSAPPVPSDQVTMVIVEIGGKHGGIAQVDAIDLGGPAIAAEDDLSDVEVHLSSVWSRHGALRTVERGVRRLAVFASPEVALDAALEARGKPSNGRSGANPVPVSVGVHTGQLRVSAGGFWGDDVHFAARLAELADRGQVLVSAATAALAPHAPLTDLGEHRMSGEPVPRRLFGLGDGPHTVLRSGDPLRSNLPRAHGELIGRDGECAELTAALGTHEHRIVTITGPGGSGKTRLALAVAEASVDGLADGAFFVPLAQVSEPGDVAAAIAVPLGIRLPAAGEHSEAIGRALADRELLLVLDNFEHLLDATPLIAELVMRAPRLRVLVTSQAALRLRGERVLALGPLQVPQEDDRDSVATAPAGRLLIERARDADSSFEVTADNAEALARLCRALDGLPLALELAAARLHLLSADQLLARLDLGLDAIGRGSRDLPARQRGLRAALDWTHALLSHDQAALLRRLGVFAGPVPLERIEQVCGAGSDLLDCLSQLVELSLVRRTPDARFVLHASVRAFAREKLEAAGEVEEIARLHAVAHADAAMYWGKRFLFDVGAVHSAVLSEQADIAQALNWSANNDQDCFARLAGGASMALHIVARLVPWSAKIEEALIRDAVTGRSRTWLLLAASLVAFERGDQPLACARLEATIAAAEATTDTGLAALMRTCSIIFQVLSGVTDGIRDDYTLLTALVAEQRDDEFTELVRGLEAYVLGYCEGRYSEAGAIWGAQITDRARTDFAGWTALYCYPDCSLLDGDPQAALDGFRAVLQSALERGQSPTVAYLFEGMSMALAALGCHQQALEAAGWAASVRQTAGPAPNSWYRRLLERSLAEARAALDADVAAAAYERGRGLTLDAAVNAALSLEPAPVHSQ